MGQAKNLSVGPASSSIGMIGSPDAWILSALEPEPSDAADIVSVAIYPITLLSTVWSSAD